MPERPLVTVGGLIVAPDGDILLVRSKKWSDLYSLPGGKVELGETREEAFRREVLEETGLLVGQVEFALVQDCIFSTEFWQAKHFVMNDFIGYLHEESSKDKIRLNDEAYEFQWISPEKADALPLHQECRHLINWYKRRYLKPKKRLGVIGFQHHAISCVVGVHPHERIQEQTLYVDVKVKADFYPAAQSEQIEKTASYVQLAELCARLAKEKQYFLLETFACDATRLLIEKFEVEWAWIRIKKPSAIEAADCAFVEFERWKGE